MRAVVACCEPQVIPCGLRLWHAANAYDSGDHQDFHHWLGLSLSNTNWAATSSYSADFWGRELSDLPCLRGPNPRFHRAGSPSRGRNDNYLDPAFKVSDASYRVDSRGIGLNTNDDAAQAGCLRTAI